MECLLNADTRTIPKGKKNKNPTRLGSPRRKREKRERGIRMRPMPNEERVVREERFLHPEKSSHQWRYQSGWRKSFGAATGCGR